MTVYPKVRSVVPLSGKRLLVTFENEVQKIYDCTSLLETAAFRPLKNDWLFRMVQADSGGYGISWNEDLDLSEAELWENGELVTRENLIVR